MSLLRRIFLCVFVVLFFLVPSALAQNDMYYDFADNSLGLYLPSTWTVLTNENLSEQSDVLHKMGVDSQSLIESFALYSISAQVTTPSGSQFLLKVFPAPSQWSFADFLQEKQQAESLFETWVMQHYHNFQGGNWIDDHFFLLQHQAATSDFTTYVYATFLGHNIIIWEIPVFDRIFSQEEESEVLLALHGLVYLGEQKTEEETPASAPIPTLPPASIEGSDIPLADIKITRDNTPIFVDDLPSIWGSTILPVSGTSEPLAEMRYYIDNVGHQRFTADEQGVFHFDFTGLQEGKNTISIQSIGKNGYGNVLFTIQVQREHTPLILTPSAKEIDSNVYTLSGVTLPNATVTAKSRQKTVEGIAQEDGTFFLEVSLPRLGENSVSVTSLATGYRKQTQEITLHRIEGAVEALESFHKEIANIPYEDLISSPQSFEGEKIKLAGTLLRFTSYQGQPSFVFEEKESSNHYHIQCDSLIPFTLGDEFEVYATLTGDYLPAHIAENSSQLPTATLFTTVFPQMD
ncbi:MAG: hypothetical protein GX786_02160 [Clostridiales bacterium]|nr:hypothetical protein [Clostridiales bacterium]